MPESCVKMHGIVPQEASKIIHTDAWKRTCLEIVQHEWSTCLWLLYHILYWPEATLHLHILEKLLSRRERLLKKRIAPYSWIASHLPTRLVAFFFQIIDRRRKKEKIELSWRIGEEKQNSMMPWKSRHSQKIWHTPVSHLKLRKSWNNYKLIASRGTQHSPEADFARY